MRNAQVITICICFILCFCTTEPNAHNEENEATVDIEQEEDIQNEAADGFSENFYIKLKGTISDIPITMQFTKKQDGISGSYYYNKIGTPLEIFGTQSPDGTIELEEYAPDGNKTGAFNGKLTSDGVFKGEWTNYTNGKTLSFNLQEIKDGSADIIMEEYHKENCEYADKNKANWNDDMWSFDTMCTELTLEMITIDLADKHIAEKINQSILDKLTGDSYATLDDYLNQVNDIGYDEGFSKESSHSVITNDNNILSIFHSEYYYGFGAAHPNSYGYHLNYNLTTGEEISLDDIFSPRYKEKLNRIAEPLFTENYGAEGWSFEPGKFELNKNFAIQKDGLYFFFNAYEIGPYAAGAPDVFIPFENIRHLIDQEGILSNWIN